MKINVDRQHYPQLLCARHKLTIEALTTAIETWKVHFGNGPTNSSDCLALRATSAA